MAKLYFYYGAMGSSKTANALMAEYNYRERGQTTLLAKTNLDTRFGAHMMVSRVGLQKECLQLTDIVDMPEDELLKYDAIIIDEIQFATPEQIDFLAHIVDDLSIPVLCYGLRTDFQTKLFPGSRRLLELADEIKEIKTVCWCGKKATCNARFNEQGIVREGQQVLLGANDEYIALCRKHHREGKLSAND